MQNESYWLHTELNREHVVNTPYSIHQDILGMEGRREEWGREEGREEGDRNKTCVSKKYMARADKQCR